MPINLENQFIADTYKSMLHIGDINLNSGAPNALIYTGNGFSSSLTISTPGNGITVTGKATITGDIAATNAVFIGSLNSGSHNVNGGSTISSNVTIGGTLSSGSHTVNGDSIITRNVSLGGALSAVGNTTLRGTANISGNTVIGGTLNSLTHTVVGNSNISGTLNSASHTVNGNSNISGDATIVGSLTSLNARFVNRVDATTIRANTYENLPVGLTTGVAAAAIFPVGSIYLTFGFKPPDQLNPTAFAGTNWQQIAQGSFLLGVGSRTDSNYPPMIRSFAAAGPTTGYWKHKLTKEELAPHTHGGVMRYPRVGRNPYTEQNQEGRPEDFVAHTQQTDSTGDGQPHENTPPGFAIYVWQRIS